jgi:tetratricopeptide (TPR) repeat protein
MNPSATPYPPRRLLRGNPPAQQRRLWRCAMSASAALLLAAAPALGQSPAMDPALACYRAAVEGSRDAYPCDLAVQVARDAGDAQELAAALANRAMILVRVDRLGPALQDLDAAVQATPGNAQLHGNRGNLLLRMNRPSEALAAHGRAVTLAPEDPASYYNRAFSYQALGDPARASADVASAERLLRGARPEAAATAAGTRASGEPQAR